MRTKLYLIYVYDMFLVYIVGVIDGGYKRTCVILYPIICVYFMVDRKFGYYRRYMVLVRLSIPIYTEIWKLVFTKPLLMPVYIIHVLYA